MQNSEVQTLTGAPVLDAPVRQAQAQQTEASNACFQDAQSTWKRPEDIAPSQQNGDNVTTQLSPSATGKAEQSKCGGLPSLEIDGLDSNVGPFNPNNRRFDKDNKGGCPEFEQRQQNLQPEGRLPHGRPDSRHNPHQGGPSELHGVPGYGDNPDFVKPEFGKSDLQKKHFEKDGRTGPVKDKLDGSKCGGTSSGGETNHPETHTTQRRMTESERISEQKLIDQKIREMKLREPSRL